MDLVPTIGLMVEYMKVNINMIKNMEKADINGQTVEYMMANGLMENSMDLGNIYCQMDKLEMVSG